MASLWKFLVVSKRFLALIFVWIPSELTKLFLSKFVPSVRKEYNEDFNIIMYDTALQPKDYENSIYSLGYLRQCFRSRYLDIYKEAFLGSKAPNPRVLSLDGVRETSLLAFQKQDRPLVLNFGSCT